MAEDQRLSLDRLSGAGFAPGQVPVWDGRTFKPGAAGGAGVVGYCQVSVTSWSGTLTSNGLVITSTALSLSDEVGNHGISVAGGEISYGGFDEDDVTLYQVATAVLIDPTTNATPADVHMIDHSGEFDEGTMLIVGSLSTYSSTFTQLCLNGGGSYPIEVLARCNLGTDRSYNIQQWRLFISRFAIAA